jgi:hypothetical protein
MVTWPMPCTKTHTYTYATPKTVMYKYDRPWRSLAGYGSTA